MKKTFQHPAHAHALCLRKLSDDFISTLFCQLCEERIHGSTYCCEKCNLFLHESCFDLPSEIQHPFHSRHPLILIHDLVKVMRCRACHCLNCLIYRCELCDFSVDAPCALATSSWGEAFHIEQGDESNATIAHFAHNHPLRSYHANFKSKIKCRACSRELSGDIYGCCHCIFFLHKRCAELPREIWQYPFHSWHCLTLAIASKERVCDLCNECSKSGYGCVECRFNLDIGCALSVLALEALREENGSTMDHPFHRHQLSSFHVKREDNEKVECKVCRVEISGEAYGCLKCVYFLHKSCAQLPREIKHPLHDKHPLTLSSEGNYLRCGLCTCPMWGSFSFGCETCGFYLDIECARQDPTDSPLTELPTHDHPLKHIYVTKPGGSNCKLCEGAIEGEAYQCSDVDCNVRFHKSCSETPTEIPHAFHPQHPLTLLTRNPGNVYSCIACQYGYRNYYFGCGECKFYLDFNCAIGKTAFRWHHLHEHSLTYRERNWSSTSSHCNFCGHICKIDFFCCGLCDFNIHYDCTLLLPKTYNHRRHIHPLTLHDPICDDDLGEYCCDICEKDRNPNCGVYYCEQCNYVAHIECVIPVVDPGIIGTKEILPNLVETIATIQEEIKKRDIKVDELKEEMKKLNEERRKLDEELKQAE